MQKQRKKSRLSFLRLIGKNRSAEKPKTAFFSDKRAIDGKTIKKCSDLNVRNAAAWSFFAKKIIAVVVGKGEFCLQLLREIFVFRLILCALKALNEERKASTKGAKIA